MSNDIDNPEAAIPWPGFVDILSAVIMVFIFFVMITVVIISQLDQRKYEYEKESAVNEDTITEVKNMSQEELVAILEENKEMQKKLEAIYFTQDNNGKSVTQNIDLVKNTHAIIHYRDLGVTVLDKILTELRKMPYQGKKIDIISYVPRNIGFTTKQEIALNRSFNIRNIYLDKGISADNVTLKINKNIQAGLEKCSKEDVYGCVHIRLHQ